MTACAPPNIEERLSAAAYRILTDHNDHSRQAFTWAKRYLRSASKGSRTAFQRYMAGHTPRVHTFAEEAA